LEHSVIGLKNVLEINKTWFGICCRFLSVLNTVNM